MARKRVERKRVEVKVGRRQAHTLRPARVKGIFIHGGEYPTLCADCLNLNEYDNLRARLGNEDVEVWEEHSDGWIEAPVCDGCDLSLPVYVNAREDRSVDR